MNSCIKQLNTICYKLDTTFMLISSYNINQVSYVDIFRHFWVDCAKLSPRSMQSKLNSIEYCVRMTTFYLHFQHTKLLVSMWDLFQAQFIKGNPISNAHIISSSCDFPLKNESFYVLIVECFLEDCNSLTIMRQTFANLET